MPAFFDHVHLTITLQADTDDAMLSPIIDQTLTRLCPITACLPGSGEVTAQFRIVRVLKEEYPAKKTLTVT
jgi:uncharacterized OsmC-like protein